MCPSAEAKPIDPQKPIQPGTFRHEVLSTARRFKSSWVDLGKLLVRVRNEGLHEEWGYSTFEAYCFKELHIRRQTALKLTNSYAFLERHEREALEKDPEDRPAFEVVEVLARAEESGQLSDEEYASIRQQIWSDERPPIQLARELRERYPAPAAEPPTADAQLRRFAAQARRFAEELVASRRVPKAVGERAEALADELAELAAAHEE